MLPIIHQQVLSQPLAGSGSVDSQSAKVRHRYGITGQALAQVLWHMIKRYGNCRECIVAMHFVRARGAQGHEVLADPGSLVLAREAPKILIKRRDATVKGLAIMPLLSFSMIQGRSATSTTIAPGGGLQRFVGFGFFGNQRQERLPVTALELRGGRPLNRLARRIEQV